MARSRFMLEHMQGRLSDLLRARPEPRHPKGTNTRVLLTSVFGPYAQDDEFGSRAINPMELYHNQVTRVQGPFSLRMFHRSWGLMMIQANIHAPCTLLDFPTRQRFIEELLAHDYDVIGISSIVVNEHKVEEMCGIIRFFMPNAVIVVGGHIANVEALKEKVGADIVVRGDGIRWFREYLGEDADQPIRHPQIQSGIGARSMGISAKDRKGDVAATLIPGVGCPMGCNFCSTSWMFGGKGKCTDFYKTGEEVFDIMCQLEASMKVSSFFVMDENFLLNKKRALRLLELMEANNKAWSLYVFTSAGVLKSYTIDQLVRLGISWVWMGLEGKQSKYSKLNGVDTHDLVRELQSHGIRVLGSTIIGLEEHTPENIDAAIDFAVEHHTDCHQFMLYTPIPGTPLHKEIVAQGRLLPEEEFDIADMHGQDRFNYRHASIPSGMESSMLLRAFEHDFRINGPILLRIVETTLKGWKRYKNIRDARVRRRFRNEARELATKFSAIIWACRQYSDRFEAARTRITGVLNDLYEQFGIKARISASIGGRFLLRSVRREERRLNSGWTYEPPTFYERNFYVSDAVADLCSSVVPRVESA